MEHITIGRNFIKGKIAYAQCLKNSPLQEIRIKDQCFLLIVLLSGSLEFEVKGRALRANAPCFICFDETEDPRLIAQTNASYYCIYFHPMYLNINMTFDFLRAKGYEDIATVHDLFLLKPFLDQKYLIPLNESYRDGVENACRRMGKELQEQQDWYWSCRGRSYFMEVIIALERMYGLIGYGEKETLSPSAPTIRNPKLHDAVLYIEGHYMEPITLAAISDAAGLNHTSLTRLFKAEYGQTAMEYLMQYRIKIGKKKLAFTEVPIKEIAHQCGFKTVPHFNRAFKERVGSTPADFRKSAVQKRKDEIR